jgi:hypothetical protein
VAGQPKPEVDYEMNAPEMKELMDFMKEMGWDPENKPISERPAKLLLVCGRQKMFDMVSVRLNLYDSNGKVIHSGSAMLRTGVSMFGGIMGDMDFENIEGLAAPGQPPKPPKASTEKDDPIELSPIAKEIAGMFGSGFMDPSSFPKLSPEVENCLLRPDVFDPLSFEISESLLYVGKKKNWNVVANLPDSLAGGMFSMSTSSQGVNAFIESSKKNRSLIWKEAEGWLTVQPSRPFSNRKHRVNRAALAKLLSASKAKGVVALDDLSDYAQVNDDPVTTAIAMRSIMLFAPGAMSRGLAGTADWNLVRFYGTLGAIQRKAMAGEGLQVGFMQLNPNQKSLIERLTFGMSSQIELGPEKEGFGIPVMDFQMGMMGKSGGSWKEEPTELMPTGLPSQGTFTVKSSNSFVGTVEGDANPISRMMGAIGPEEIAFFRLLKDVPGIGEQMNQMPNIEKLKVGTRTTFKFTFNVGEDASVRKSLTDDQIKRDAQVADLNNPSPELKAQIDAATERIKKSPFFKMMMSMGGMGAPSRVPPRN